tara:strand:- start:277 stop:486 length:210 start_codon:yes stop_codon:yes gene_type:complete
MSKNNYDNIAVWDLTFYRLDDDGNPLEDDDGKVITYRVENYGTSYLGQHTNRELAEGLDIEDLEEVSDE